MILLRRLLDAYRRRRWPRRIAVGLCLAMAGVTALDGRAVAPRVTAARVAVVVARHDLAAGARITGGDIRVALWPRELIPPAALRAPRQAIGRRVAGPVTASEVLTAPRLVGPSLAAGLPPDTAAIPVPVSGEHTAEFVRAGDHVDVYATREQPDATAPPASGPPARVAADLLVLAVLPGGPGAADAFPTTSESNGGELIVAAHTSDVVRLEASTGYRLMAVVIAPRPP